MPADRLRYQELVAMRTPVLEAPSTERSRDVLRFIPQTSDPAGMLLSEFYWHYFRDCVLDEVSHRTRNLYEDALAWFTRTVGDLPLRELSGAEGRKRLAVFKRLLFESGLAEHTVHKHFRHLKRILRKAGPEDEQNNRDAFGFIERPAWVRNPKLKHPEPRNVSEEEFVQVYLACRVARLPKIDGVRAPDWWQTLMQVTVSRGPRSGTSLRIRSSDFASQLSDVTFGPDDKTGRSRTKELSDGIVEQVRKIYDSEREYLFTWPHRHRVERRMGPVCIRPDCGPVMTGMSLEFRRIQTAAGLPRPQQFRIHDLRRTAGTLEALSVAMRAAGDLLDHSPGSGTTARYYVPERIVGEVVGKITSARLLAKAKRAASRQMLLFEID